MTKAYNLNCCKGCHFRARNFNDFPCRDCDLRHKEEIVVPLEKKTYIDGLNKALEIVNDPANRESWIYIMYIINNITRAIEKEKEKAKC